jgi:hypothetical protein
MSARPLAALLTALAAASSLAACGGSSSGGGAPPADLASLSAQEILDASVAALGTVHSYRVAGTLEDKDGHTRLSADVNDAGSVRASYTTAGSTVSYIVVGQQSYIRGDRKFWLDGKTDRVSRRLANLFAGRWVKVPRSQTATLQKDIRRLLPKEQAYCLPRKIGTLTKVGVRTVRGRRVVVIRDRGDVPGGTPGELSVATHGRALPMRERQTGRTRKDGAFEPRCDDKDDTSTRSDATLSHYDKIPPITPPPHPFDPGQLVPPTEGGLSA